jgi:hypothetical protein
MKQLPAPRSIRWWGVLGAFAVALTQLAATWSPGPESIAPATIEGVIDVPANGSSVPDGAVTVAGWAVDRTAEGWSGIDKVHLYEGTAGSGGRLLAEGNVGLDRPDVATALDYAYFDKAGFSVTIPPGTLGVGPHDLTVYAHTPGRGWWSRGLSIRVTPPVCDPGDDAVSAPPTPEVDRTGRGRFAGSVRNRCRVPINAEVDVTVYNASGVAVAVAPSAYLEEVPSGGSATYETSVTGLSRSDRYTTRVRWSWHAASAAGETCREVGLSHCLNVDGWLLSAVYRLRDSDVGRSLLTSAATHDVHLVRGQVPSGAYALFGSRSNSVTVDRRMDASSDWERAAVLAHALHHAADFAESRLDGSPDACYSSEAGALITEAAMWAQLWNDRLPTAQNGAQSDLNTITLSIAQDPFGFMANTLSSRPQDCDG